MLESILLAVVLSWAFGHIAISIFGMLFDRPWSAKQKQQHLRQLQEMTNKTARDSSPARSGS